MNLNDTFHGITTLVVVQAKNQETRGTGFFYSEMGSPDEKSPQWSPIEETWLVTNRHVLLPKIDEKETIPDKVVFHLRKLNGNTIDWLPIELEKSDLLKRAKFHTNPKVDVGIVKILDLVTEILKKEPKTQDPGKTSIMNFVPMSNAKLPGKNKIDVDASDDVLIIGYPRGYYDKTTKYPIIKSGIIASRWGDLFQGNPCFLVDAKLFPGSSGSIVISKPIDSIIEKGQMLTSKEKQFAFLGIFSGEPYIESPEINLENLTIKFKEGFNVGIVWYGNLIDDIIKNGQELKEP